MLSMTNATDKQLSTQKKFKFSMITMRLKL